MGLISSSLCSTQSWVKVPACSPPRLFLSSSYSSPLGPDSLSTWFRGGGCELLSVQWGEGGVTLRGYLSQPLPLGRRVPKPAQPVSVSVCLLSTHQEDEGLI